MKFGGREEDGRTLRGKAGLRKACLRVEGKETVEREKLRIQAPSQDNDTMVVEPGGYRSTQIGEQGL